jgi:dimeric dUTPase (all-alpha-NTP-PPase superfamily)
MDKLNAMLAKQLKFQQRLGTLCFSTEKERTTFIKEHCQYADQEMHELMRELKYFKSWKKYPWSETELLEHLKLAKMEFIDVLTFILNVALALGMTAEEIFSLYEEKNSINHLRQDTEY